MVKIKFLDETCTRRTCGIYRFDPDGLSVKSFPGEPGEYDPAAKLSRERRKLLDRGVLTLMASAERRRRFGLVHVDGPEAKATLPEAPSPPRRQREDDNETRAKFAAEREGARADAKPAAPAEPVVSMATGLPIPVPAPPKGEEPASSSAKRTAPHAPPAAKASAPAKGKGAKG